VKITEVNIPKSQSDGLEEIKMSRLGNIVLIAGKNGAGKTRILNKIFKTFETKPKKKEVENCPNNITTKKQTIENCHQQIDMLEKQLNSIPASSSQRTNIENNIKNYKTTITSFEDAIKIDNEKLMWNFIVTDEQSDNYTMVQFVPKSLVLKDCNTLTKKDLISYAERVNSVGISNLKDGTFAKIQDVQNKWFEATHQNSKLNQIEKDTANINYENLKHAIKTFLNTDMDRDINGDATLFNFPLGQSKLSDGQKILLQLCVAIYSQGVALNDLILVMDEPENHLHPSVIIETLEQIQKSVTNGQIWIATHSIALLAHFDSSALWYVESGKITYAGRTPESVLRSLLGKDDEIVRLQDFISLPAQFATSKYAFECLLEPRALQTASNDTQVRQIRSELRSITKNGKIRVLDYGAGKGRLIANLSGYETLLQKIEYIAFDKYDNDKSACTDNIIKVFGTCDKRYYNDMRGLFSDYSKASFDVVIMCNVLHEIDPNEWLRLFRKDGEVSGCLKKNGVLLLIEDCRIPVGEMAYQKGFLVLDTPQLKDLFKIEEQDTGFSYNSSPENERLKSHIIPKHLLERITPKSRIESIKSIAETAKTEIKKIRASNYKDYKHGLLHGFWVQQLANAQLNLDELGPTT